MIYVSSCFESSIIVTIRYPLFSWCDPKVSFVPIRIINFVTRTVIGKIWAKLLHVAKDIQVGTLPNHTMAIQNQMEQYDYIQTRIEDMLRNMQNMNEKYETFQYITYLQN